jgi:hypothetical protein
VIINEIIYSVQIVLLCGAIVMVVINRKAINGLARGLVLLAILLIVRRIDDMAGVLGETGTLVLSSVVVAVFFLDVWKIHRARWLYLLWSEARQKRIAELEKMRAPSDSASAWDYQKPTSMR